jgi:uncharacterized protein YjbI with pentapeptide repeats
VLYPYKIIKKVKQKIVGIMKNLTLGNVRVIFNGERPFTISSMGKIFILLESLYRQFASYILEDDAFSIYIDNIGIERASFDLIPVAKNDTPVKFNDFQEIILCLLYSIYSSTKENVLEAIDSQAKEIQSEVQELFSIIQEGQALILMSVIEDKLVKITILPDKKVFLEKIDPTRPKKRYENLDTILEAYKENKKESFTNVNLENFELNEVNLAGANFADSELYQITMNNAILTGVNFYNADVSNSHLNHAKLMNANLVEADFSGAELKEADLTGVNLVNADLSSANLSGAILHNVNLSGADLSSSNLTGTKFTGKIKYNSDTDFGNRANWWEAEIEDEKLIEWLKKYYPRKKN